MGESLSAEWKEVCFEIHGCDEADKDCIQKAEIKCLEERVERLTKALNAIMNTSEIGYAWEIAEAALKK